jgi:hypothetical protein
MYHRVQSIYTTKTIQLMFKEVNAIQNDAEPVHVLPCIRALKTLVAPQLVHKYAVGAKCRFLKV